MIGNLLKYVCVPKIVLVDEVLTKLLQKENGAVFLPHMVNDLQGMLPKRLSSFALFNSQTWVSCRAHILCDCVRSYHRLVEADQLTSLLACMKVCICSIHDCMCAELLFGVPWKQVGLWKGSHHGVPRVITYAVTIVFHRHHHRFVLYRECDWLIKA